MQFLAGCADNDKLESYDDEVLEPKELFSFQNTENSDPSIELENEENDEDNDDDNNDTTNQHSMYYEPINPMRKYLEDLDEYPPPPFDLDVDFTTLYAYEFDECFSDVMFLNSENYMGKTIRVVGPYINFYYEDQDYYVHSVLVDDAGGCCQRYVDFEWTKDNYPDEYPETRAIIDVIGELASGYMEEYDYTFAYIIASHVVVIKGVDSE